MSYDLYFCCTQEVELSFDSVQDWASRYPQFKHEGKRQLWYQNEGTGVYFSLDYAQPGSLDAGESPIPANFFDAGLSFNLNYNRPSFFAYEAMLIVEDLARTLNLLVFDPQDHMDEGEAPPKPGEAQQLIRVWSKSNRLAVSSFEADPELKPRLMPHSKSLVWWNYMHRKPQLEMESKGIFAPRLFLVHFRKSRGRKAREVETFLTWTSGVPTLIPESDWSFIVRRKKKWPWQRSEYEPVGLLRTEQLLGSVGAYLETFDDAAKIRLLPPEKVDMVAKVLDRVEPTYTRSDFEGVAPDGFVDTEMLTGK